MMEAIINLGITLGKAALEYGVASAERRAQLRARAEAEWGAVVGHMDGFEARAIDRIKDGMSDADAKPPRPTDDDTRP